MREDLSEEIILPEGVTAEKSQSLLKIKGPKGEVARIFENPKVSITVEPGKIILKSSKASKREKTIIGSFKSHLRNTIEGVQNVHVYKLKVCSGHFPMTVSVSGEEFTIKNFLGEAVPRKVTLLPGCEVKVAGAEIVISGSDKEAAGQNAAKIESLCRITNRDKRIFQDGCYITEKAGKKI